MKKLVFVILLAFFTLGIQAQKTYVLLTGVSNYGDGDHNLHNCTKDVKDLKSIFEKQGAVVGVLTGRNVTTENIETKIKAIVQLAKPEDNIIFFFSGHGALGGLVSYGPEYISYNSLADMLAKAKTRKVFCFLDACNAGSSAASTIKDETDEKIEFNTNITFVTASRFVESSYENDWVGHGVFAQAMIKGIRGKADTNRDRKVTLIELYKYIYNDVTARTRNTPQAQHPQLIGPSSLYDTVITKW